MLARLVSILVLFTCIFSHSQTFSEHGFLRIVVEQKQDIALMRSLLGQLEPIQFNNLFEDEWNQEEKNHERLCVDLNAVFSRLKYGDGAFIYSFSKSDMASAARKNLMEMIDFEVAENLKQKIEILKKTNPAIKAITDQIVDEKMGDLIKDFGQVDSVGDYCRDLRNAPSEEAKIQNLVYEQSLYDFLTEIELENSQLKSFLNQSWIQIEEVLTDARLELDNLEN